MVCLGKRWSERCCVGVRCSWIGLRLVASMKEPQVICRPGVLSEFDVTMTSAGVGGLEPPPLLSVPKQVSVMAGAQSLDDD